MTLIQIDRSQNQQQKTSSIPPQSTNDRAKLNEFLYDSQLEWGQHILQIKMAEALSRILEAYFLERRSFV